jgi:hypothetical protein
MALTHSPFSSAAITLPPTKSPQPEKTTAIVRIYAYNAGFGIKDSEYLIDIKNAKLYSFISNRSLMRDTYAENEGYQKVMDLDRGKIDTFLDQAEKLGFTEWKHEYVNPDVFDGYQWGITIFFADGKLKIISGSNAHPDTWDGMYDAFNDLTGVPIIDTKSDGFIG